MREAPEKQPLARAPGDAHALARLHDAIARVQADPRDAEARRQLRATVAQPAIVEPAVAILGDEARVASADRDARLTLLEALVDALDTLDRPIEAIDALEQLIAIAPDHVAHLYDLATRCEQFGAWQKAANAFSRVGALASRDQACTALRAAARLYREHAQPVRAIESYRALLAFRPGDQDAARALAELLDERDETEQEPALPEHTEPQVQLDAANEAALARATELVAAGDAESAEQMLRDVLVSRPTDPDANAALVELWIATHQRDTARQHLAHVLASAPADLADRVRARLVHAQARIAASEENADEAHRLLEDAHRLDRRALPITLDLGESYFARRLWRQAVVHLAPLAEHPDVAAHAARVAIGLVHAGIAEIRALRPANAPGHFEDAVRLDPDCAPAWHELGELALEHGDHARAVDCFERGAAATTDPAQRARSYAMLGELALTRLGDKQRAERYWTGSPDLAVLDKLLPLQRERGADADAARAETCARIAELDPARFQAMTTEAAEAFAAAGDFVRARAAAEKLMARFPLDLDAVSCATAVVLAACDAETTAAWLHRALGAWDARRVPPARLAELWLRLGDAERSRQRPVEARTAYQRAMTSAPDSPHAIAARRALMDLTPKSVRTLESLEILVEADQSPDETLALARAYVAAERIDDARATYDLALALDAPLSDQDQAFLDRTAGKPMAYDEAYGGVLDEAERRAIVDEPADAPLSAVLDALGEALSLVAPDPASALRRAGLASAMRLAATSHLAAAGMYPQISKVLGGPQTLLYASSELADPVRVVLASPPVVVVGGELAALNGVDARPPLDAMLRFRFGRAVERVRPRRLFADDARLVPALLRAFGPPSGAGDLDLADEAKRLHAAVPVVLRRRLTELVAAMPAGAFDVAAYREACARAADRSGMVACGNAKAARELAGDRVLATAASRAYRAARRAMRSRTR